MQPIELELWKAKDVARLLSLVEADRRYFQEMVASLPVAVAVVNSDLTLSSSNRLFRSMFSVRPADVAGSVEAILSTDLCQRIRSVLESKEDNHSEVDAGGRPGRVTVRAMRHWEETQVMLVVQLDAAAVTAPVKQVRPSAQAPAAIWMVDAKSMRFTEVDLGTLSLPPAEWEPAADFWGRRISPSDSPAVREFYQGLLAGKPLRSCDYQSVNAAGHAVVLRDLPRIERAPDGSARLIHGMTIDVTEARRAETQRAQGQRIEALSRLASRVVHDCNNLIMIMGGYGEDLLHALPPDSTLRVNVQEILAAGDRLSVFTKQLNAFTKRAPVSIQIFGVDTFLGSLHTELTRGLAATVSMSLLCRAGDATVSADPRVLGAVIQTLVQRAGAGLQNGGAVVVHSSLGHHGHVAGPGGTSGSFVDIEIRDTGIAIHPDVLGRLFEPDTSSDPLRQKLPVVYQSLRDMGCDLEVASHANQGASFHILIPLAQAAEARMAPPAVAPIAEMPRPRLAPQPAPPAPVPPLQPARPVAPPPPAVAVPQPSPVIPAAPPAIPALTPREQMPVLERVPLPVKPVPVAPIAQPPAPPVRIEAEPVREARREVRIEVETTPSVAEPPPAPKPPEPVSEKVTVLVVDDEAGIRSLLRKVLLREGYHVLEATQGKEGLDLARAHRGKIHLLLSDVVMPEMGGVELAKILHNERPDARLMLISGYMGATGLEAEKLPAGTAFLQKPFTLNALIAKVRDVLAAPVPGAAK